jgi:phage tail-like protein
MAITDLVGNALAAPNNTGQMIGYIEPPAAAEVLPLKMYNFLLEPIRTEDAKPEGAFFVRRFLEGPQQIWEDTQNRIFSIKNLWDLTQIPDEYLQYLKNIVGWTSSLDHITEALDYDLLRKLIGASVPLWKNRGSEDALLDVLSLVTGARNRMWNWFDFRWVLDDTQLGEEHEGRDPWIIDLPGPPTLDEYYSNLRIVDDGTLNHDLVENLCRLMRACGERIDITYIDFLDQFIIEGDDIQWTNISGAMPTVEDGKAKVTGAWCMTVTNRDDASSWNNYVAYWRLRQNEVAGQRAFCVFYHTDNQNYYRLELRIDTNTVVLAKFDAGAWTVIANVAYTPWGTLYEDVFYGLRADVQTEGATNRIKIYVDADEIINTTDDSHSGGNIGVGKTSSATGVEFDEVEMWQLPSDRKLIDINE